MYVFGNVEFNDIDLGYMIAVDRVNDSLDCRKNPPSALEIIEFRSQDPDASTGITPRYSDCMMVFDSAEPEYFCDGFVNVVSEKARDRLEPLVKDEIAFIKTEVSGASEKYFILWPKVICDVVAEDADLIESPPGSGRYRFPRKVSLDASKCSANYYFRLPGWRYNVNVDLATSKFVRLVHENKLSGFGFRSGINGKPVRAIDILRAEKSRTTGSA